MLKTILFLSSFSFNLTNGISPTWKRARCVNTNAPYSFLIHCHPGKKIGEEITETKFVKTLSKNIQGQITLTSEETSVATEAYNSAGYAQKVGVANLYQES